MSQRLICRFAEVMPASIATVVLAVVLAHSPARGQQPTTFGSNSGVTCPGGNLICNGSINFMITELFFEPETPPFLLKKGNVTWNELEQLLDNPYNLTTGAPCNDANGRIPVLSSAANGNKTEHY